MSNQNGASKATNNTITLTPRVAPTDPKTIKGSIIESLALEPKLHTAENFIVIYDFLEPRYRAEFVELWMSVERAARALCEQLAALVIEYRAAISDEDEGKQNCVVCNAFSDGTMCSTHYSLSQIDAVLAAARAHGIGGGK